MSFYCLVISLKTLDLLALGKYHIEFEKAFHELSKQKSGLKNLLESTSSYILENF